LKVTVVAAATESQTRRRERHRLRHALAGVALLAVACSPGPQTPSETVREYYDAVQERDFDRLYCLMAGASEAVELGNSEAERRDGFQRWARAYSRPAGPDAVVVESRIRFGYAHIDLSPFSPGTTFYVCGAPVGRVYPIRVPVGSGEVTLEVLDGVRVAWTLVRVPAAAGCPGGWRVASGEPVEGSATTIEITWVF
jgi:hypothetical protein